MNVSTLKKVTIGLAILAASAGCTMEKQSASTVKAQSASLPSTGNPADQEGIAGVPGAAVPTAEAIVARIQNGVKNNAVPTAGNFRAALTQIGTNLPANTNPLLATGYDQVPLLAYAACSDINLSAYGITGSSIVAAKAALVAAGVNIVDQHTGGLGSTGPLAPQVAAIFGKLVDDNARISGETVQIAFISVCMTASTFGAQMLGF